MGQNNICLIRNSIDIRVFCLMGQWGKYSSLTKSKEQKNPRQTFDKGSQPIEPKFYQLGNANLFNIIHFTIFLIHTPNLFTNKLVGSVGSGSLFHNKTLID